MMDSNPKVEARKAKTVAEKLLRRSYGSRSSFTFYPHGFVGERGEDGWEDVTATVGEWLVGLAVACEKEVDPAEVAEISFQLGKLVGREGFLEVLN